MAARLVVLAAVLLARPAHNIAQEGADSLRPRTPTVAAIALSIRSRAIQDSRCYLKNGGAVESFYISEDTPVGAVIGELSVNGDPSEPDGNISLRLQEKNAGVGIVPGTRNLTLLRPLDREERAGPSNVYVNVRCDRRRTTDPSFIIPVSIRVWDVNDNAPVWVGAPYRIRLSELTAVGSRVLADARAVDADQPGPHATIHYSVVPGPHSDYFEFVNELDSILVVRKPLDFETLPNFTVTLRASDQGTEPRHNDTTLTVQVLDADDQNPKFSHEHYTAVLPEDAEEGTFLDMLPEPILARDQDVGIDAPLQYAASGDGAALVAVQRDDARVAVTRRLLTSDLPVTVVIKATQADNPDRYALATLTVSGPRRGRGVRFSVRAYSAHVPEDAAPGTVVATLRTEPAQGPLQFYVSERSFLEKFAINGAGEVVLRRALDFEAQSHYQYQVMVTDGIHNDTASINITVVNVNEWEPRFRYPQYEFRVDDVTGDPEGGLVPVGKLDVHDGDKPDTVTLTLRGSDASMFYLAPSGEMYLRQEALPSLNASVLHVVATAVDSGSPPRQTSVPVLVHVSRARTSRGAVLAVFAGALAALALVVLALLGYIYRSKRRSKPPTSPTKPNFVSHERRGPHSATLPAGVGADGGPSLSGPMSGGLASSGSLLSVSAGASTILANSSSSLDLRGDTLNTNNGTRNATIGRQSQRFPTKTKIAPLPPGVESPQSAGSARPGSRPHTGSAALLSDHVGSGAAGRSGVAWPSATIPARVKKLSWDDADPHTEIHKDSADPVHDATNPALQDHLNLTVYF